MSGRSVRCDDGFDLSSEQELAERNDEMEKTVVKEPTADQTHPWANFENLIYRGYLPHLQHFAAVSERTEDGFDFHKACECIKMDHVVRIVYDKDENNLAKLNSVYSSLVTSGQSVFVLIRRANNKTEFYVGTRGRDEDAAVSGCATLNGAVRGNFPGVELDATSDSLVKELSGGIFKKRCVSIVTGVPDIKEGTEESFSQGVEKIIDAQGSKEFTALILADPVDADRLLELEKGYQTIATQLSLMNVSQLSLSRQDTNSVGKSISESVSKTLSDSLSLARTTSTSIAKTKTPTGAITSVGVAAGAGIGTALGPAGTATGAAIGAAIGGAVGSIAGAFFGTKTKTDTEGETNTSTHTVSLSKTGTVTFTGNISQTVGTAVSYTVQDRRVVDALAIVDEQLKRLRMAKNYGAWRYAAYFISDVAEHAKAGANIFAGVLRGERTGVERSSVTNWTSENRQFRKIIADLSCFAHPQFCIGKDAQGTDIVIEPTSVVTTNELAVGMSFPQKSIPGLPVFDSVEFGRSVSTYDKYRDSDRCVRIGSLYHLGEADKNQDVTLNVDSLCSHVFVTGSTGAGKSNFVYSLLNELHKRHGVEFLVVEPAKGEYKGVFGDVPVFGTNPYKTSEILRVNPFSFPGDIHVMEHIDRLIEILNAAWPMYAAMPAILKDAVEETYKRQGWDLVRSVCRESRTERIFPDFKDLLDVLPDVINASKYDSEVKNNYTGALVTRVKALTNGYYRMIFQKDELSEKRLLDESCIVDISRVGSAETKSLLMGVIFLKLHEHRMSQPVKPNSPLKHVTVLEEAHNLLRKTSTEQGMETANLAGKSVELLTNAIAEMRTYGEGFVVADQAPGLLDTAVIRNTNTKVVFRLPDMEDRLLVGKAENLNEDQIGELARLERGCAAVYQNNWLEAVLCQTEKFDKDVVPYECTLNPANFIDGRAMAERAILKILLGRMTRSVEFSTLLHELSENERGLLNTYFRGEKLCEQQCMTEKELIDEVYLRYVRKPLGEVPPIKDKAVWTKTLLRRIFADEGLQALAPKDKDVILRAVFNVLSRYDGHIEQRDGWRQESEQLAKWRLWK